MKKGTFKEHYIVKYNYLKPNGFWEIGTEKEISVDVVHGVNEKDNHDEAARLLIDKLKSENIVEYNIKTITYC